MIIPILVETFLEEFAVQNRDRRKKITSNALEILGNYTWPGNVRELKNLVERAVYRSKSSLITEIELDPFRSPYGESRTISLEEPESESQQPPIEALVDKPFEEAVKDLKVRLLKRALEKAKYNQRRAAQILGLTYHQFRGLYRKFGAKLK